MLPSCTPSCPAEFGAIRIGRLLPPLGKLKSLHASSVAGSSDGESRKASGCVMPSLNSSPASTASCGIDSRGIASSPALSPLWALGDSMSATAQWLLPVALANRSTTNWSVSSVLRVVASAFATSCSARSSSRRSPRSVAVRCSTSVCRARAACCCPREASSVVTWRARRANSNPIKAIPISHTHSRTYRLRKFGSIRKPKLPEASHIAATYNGPNANGSHTIPGNIDARLTASTASNTSRIYNGLPSPPSRQMRTATNKASTMYSP